MAGRRTAARDSRLVWGLRLFVYPMVFWPVAILLGLVGLGGRYLYYSAFVATGVGAVGWVLVVSYAISTWPRRSLSGLYRPRGPRVGFRQIGGILFPFLVRSGERRAVRARRPAGG